MRNEWLAKAAGSTPVPRMRERRWSVKAGRVRKALSWNWKRGSLGGVLVCWRYLCSAATGQVEVWVTPRVTVQVFRNGSVLEAFTRSRAEEGVNERSAWQRHVVVLYVLADGVQNSLARRKP